ncbi:hypothetical protein [Streptomyces sp. NPDC019224]|uniref:hypothetical protein n=1 Tax=Streptomyces sp. NPDC019224 TaxID=3154484 RepID=UPI0033C1CC3B
MTATPVCTCLPGATLWLPASPAARAAAQDLATLLTTGHHRRVTVLDTAVGDVPGEPPEAAVRRTGLVAEILAANGFLAVVLDSAAQPAGLDAVRARHRSAGTPFLEPAVAAGAPPDLFRLLDEYGLALPR